MNHGQPSTPAKPITMNTVTKNIDVDNHISLGNYYGIADNLLKQKLLDVLEELESLKPECQRRVNELNKGYTETQQQQFDGCKEKTSDGLNICGIS